MVGMVSTLVQGRTFSGRLKDRLNERFPVATSVLELSPERPMETAEAEDLRLVEALRAGSERAYEELIQRFQQPVYALALRLLADSSEASDVVQEVFLKVF